MGYELRELGMACPCREGLSLSCERVPGTGKTLTRENFYGRAAEHCNLPLKKDSARALKEIEQDYNEAKVIGGCKCSSPPPMWHRCISARLHREARE